MKTTLLTSKTYPLTIKVLLLTGCCFFLITICTAKDNYRNGISENKKKKENILSESSKVKQDKFIGEYLKYKEHVNQSLPSRITKK